MFINGAVLEMNYRLPQGTLAGFAIHLVLESDDLIKIIGKYDIVDRRAHEKINREVMGRRIIRFMASK